MNWHQRIAEARKRGSFTHDDDDLAADWVTCACGEQDPRIPRDGEGCPADKVLRNIGIEFFVAVEDDDFDLAERVLESIEKRAAEVLAAL